MSDLRVPRSVPENSSDRANEQTAGSTAGGLDSNQYQQGAAPKVDSPKADGEPGTLEIKPLFGADGKVIADAKPANSTVPGAQFSGEGSAQTSSDGSAQTSGNENVNTSGDTSGQTSVQTSDKPATSGGRPPQTDAQGTLWHFNKDGKPLQAEKKDGTTIDYVYSQNGELERYITRGKDGLNAFTKDGKPLHAEGKDGTTVDFEYGQNGELERRIIHGKQGWTAVRNGYDLPLITEFNGISTTYHYDSNNRLSELENSDGISFKFASDPAGAGHWEKFEHGVDKGRVSSLQLNLMNDQGDKVLTLTNRSLSAYELSRAGCSGTGDVDEQDRVALRESTFANLKTALAGDTSDSKNHELINQYCLQIGSFTAQEKAEFLDEYHLKTGHDLVSDLKQHNLSLAEAYVSRTARDGGTEEARAKEALYQIGGGSKDSASVLRNSLSRLNSAQIADLEKTQPPFSQQLKTLLEQHKLSEESYKTALLYMQNPADSPKSTSPEFHQALAEVALSANKGHYKWSGKNEVWVPNPDSASDPERLQLLREALGDQGSKSGTEAAEAARTTLVNAGAQDKLEKIMDTDNARLEAKDILQVGTCSILTRARQTSGWYANQQTLTDAIKADMTQQERLDFAVGRRKVEQLTPTQREDFMSNPAKHINKEMDYYRDLQNAFYEAAGTCSLLYHQSKTAMVHEWDDLAEHGKTTLEGQIAQQYGMGTNGSTADFEKVLNNMSKEDFAHLQADPQYNKLIQETLSDLIDGGSGFDIFAADRLQRRIQGITNSGGINSEDYHSFTGTKVSELPANAGADQIRRSLTDISPAEVKELRQSDYKRKELENKIGKISNEAEREALKNMEARLLSQNPAKTKQSSQADAGDQLLFAVGAYKDGKLSQADLRKQFLALSNDASNKTLADQLSSRTPGSDQAKKLDAVLRSTLGAEYTNEMLPILRHVVHLDNLIEQNKIDNPTRDKELNVYHHYHINFNNFVSSLETLNSDDRSTLANMAKNGDGAGIENALPYMTREQRDQVITILGNNVLDKGHGGIVRPEDVLHMYIMDKDATASDAKNALANLTPDQVQRVKAEYARKYDRDLILDLTNRAPDGIRPELLHLANPDRNKFADAMDEVNQIDQTLRTGCLKDVVRTWDGSGGRVDQLVHQLAIADDPEKRTEIKTQLAIAITDEKGTAKQVSNAILEAIFLSSSVVTLPLDGWLAAGVMASEGTVFKPTVNKAVQGATYGNDGQNVAGTVLGQAVSGAIGWGAAGAGNEVVGKIIGNPEALSMLQKVILVYGADRVNEALASAIEAYIDSHQTNAGQVGSTAAKAETRKILTAAISKGLAGIE